MHPLKTAAFRHYRFCTTGVAVSATLLALGCGGGGGNNGGGGGNTNPPPTITSVAVSCPSSTIPTGQTAQCNATVSGTGSFSTAVTWEVNGAQGGSATYGTVSSSGLYQAPTTAPQAYIVSITAVSSADNSKSGSASLQVAGTISTASQPISAANGGTISLPGGASATIPAGFLAADSTATLQLSSVPTQPTNTLFAGIGPSLILSFSSAGTSSASSTTNIRPDATTANAAITFTLTGPQGLSADEIQNALAVVDVNNGADNYFAQPSTFSSSANDTTITVDPTIVASNSTLTAGLVAFPGSSLSQSGGATLQVWDDASGTFKGVQNGYCPSGSRTLVMIHGMLSSPQDTFGPANGSAACSLASGTTACPVTRGPYGTVLAIDYQWWNDIGASANSIGTLLSALFDSCTAYTGTFDIEAHSEGTVVSLESTAYLTPSTKGKLKHIALIAGPLEGTPVAQDANDFILLTYYLNLGVNSAASVLMPAGNGDMTQFVGELAPASSTVSSALSAAAANVPSTEIIAAGGDNPQPDLYWYSTWLNNTFFLQGEANDGIIPVSSSLPDDANLPNFVRLFCSSSQGCAIAYPFNHTHLVNNANVMTDVFSAVQGAGVTQDVTVNISPTSQTLSAGQSIALTASTTNILNPLIQWSLPDGSGSGSLSATTGSTVQYTAPQTSGTYHVRAALAALPVAATSTITVNGSGTGIAVSVAPAAVSVLVNNTQQFTSTVTGTSNTAVSWSIQEGSAGGIITSQGVYTAPSSPGTYHVVATSAADSSASGIAAVTVTSSQMTISPSSVSVPVGSTQTFAAYVPKNGSVSWSIQEGSGGGTITATGIYTAPSTTGTFHVVATNNALQQTATATVNVVAAPSYSVLYSFPYAFESAALVQGADGDFYGTNEMISFKIDSSGNFTQLGQISSSPSAPISNLIQTSDGTFYGVDSQNDSIFTMDTSGNIATLFTFPNIYSSTNTGAWTWAGIVQASDGNFYGTTYAGGNLSCTPWGWGVPAYGPFDYAPLSGYGCGTIFRVDRSGTETGIYAFSGQTDGNFPQATVVQGSDGYLYGTTSGGGANGYGTIFKISLSGQFQVLHSFSSSDDAAPVAPLIQASDGYLYGTAACVACTTSKKGEVFKIDTSGNNFTILHSFTGADGALPVAPFIQGKDGNFYGTTWAGGDLSCGTYYFNVGSNYPYLDLGGCGTVFKMDSGGNITVLHNFEEPQSDGDGDAPYAGLIQGKDGYLYGTTYAGGTSVYFGTVFKIGIP